VVKEILCLVFIGVVAVDSETVWGQPPQQEHPQLQASVANAWAELVLKGIDTEFPNKLSLMYSNESQIARPRAHFPAFYGCFDWHSSVHGHWVLVRLLKKHPEMASASRVRTALRQHLTPKNLGKEAEFFSRDEQKTFERMYGWAWLLRLVIELDSWNDPDAEIWRQNLAPLEKVLVARIMDYLPRLTYPIRIGQHTDTSFALGQILDYAKAMGNDPLQALVKQRATDFYANDLAYPIHYEPSGHDFFSSCWNEADLMRRVLTQREFVSWLAKFLPQLETQLTDGTVAPVVVSDVTDPKIVHLAGLNLNRAWCLQSVAAALPITDPLCDQLTHSASLHMKAGLKYINSGHYEGDHWLATFGLYAIERIAVEQ